MQRNAAQQRNGCVGAAMVLLTILLTLNHSAQSQGRIYWAEPEHSAIRSTAVDGSNPALIAQGILMISPNEIDADESGRIYWTDVNAQTISRARADGSNPEILLGSLHAPYGIAIDKINKHLYWTEKGLIRRANLDGSNIVDLVTDFTWPYALEVFPENDMMFWTIAETTGGGTYRAKLDGSDIQKISDQGTSYLALEKSTESLYLPMGMDIIRMDLAGQTPETVVQFDDYVHALGAEEGANRLCWSFSAGIGCSHLDGTNPGVLTGTPRPPSGFSIDPKSRLITFTVGEPLAARVMRCSHDGSGVRDLIDPVISPADVAADPVQGMVYWVDVSRQPPTVALTDLLGSVVEELPITATDILTLDEPTSVAVDPVARRVYVGFSGSGLGFVGGIVGGAIDGPLDELLLGGGVWRGIIDIAVDPLEQQLYFVDAENNTINKIGSDGSNHTVIVEKVLAGGLAISVQEQGPSSSLTRRLLWIETGQNCPADWNCATYDKRIVSANPDGSDLKVVIDGLTDPSHLAVDDNAGLLIWSEQGSGILKRARLDGSEIQTIATSDARILGIVSVSSPSEASLEFPPPLATGLPTSVTLDWTIPPINARSDVQVASGSLANVVFALNTPHTEAWFDAPLADSDYFWRTRVVSAGGSGPWTTWSQFSVGSQGALAVALTDPPDGATGVVVEPELTWESAPSAVKYRLQVATTESFEELVIDVDTLTRTSFVPAPLDHKTTYFWRVAGVGENGASTFSSAWSFETIIAAPDAVTLSSPGAGETGVAAYAEFSWGSVDAADSYLMEVALDDQFAQMVVSTTLTETSFAVDAPLPYDTQFFWRVQASNAGGAGPWSEVRTFRTAVGTGIDTDDIPTSFELYQNYPNPFNPTTSIRFALPEASHVRLAVFDLQGREIRRLVDGAEPAGRYMVTLDAAGLPSGLYLYKLTTATFEAARTMTVVR